jgi:excisionase family DNA binding protein
MSRIMTVSETAAYLRMNRMTIYRLAQEGKIPAFKVGGSWRFDRQGIDDWIAQQVRKRAATVKS